MGLVGRGRVPAFLAFALCCAPWLAPIAAHDLAVEKVVTAYLTTEPDHADLLVRVPLDLLSAVSFPAVEGRIDAAAAGAALDEALGLVGEAIAVFENGRRVPHTGVAARLSLPSDQSFNEYGSAAAHLSQPSPAAADIYANQGFVDVRLRYPLGAPRPMVSIRSGLRADLGDSVKVTVRYLPLDGPSRQLVITSRSGRVAVNPTAYEAARRFFLAGAGNLLRATEYLLFLALLLLPLRAPRDIATVAAAVSIGRWTTLIGTGFNLARLGTWFGDLAGAVISASLVYVAIENIVRSRRRHCIAAGVLGLLLGFEWSYRLREQLPFAGPHVLLSIASFNVGVEAAQLAIVVGLAAAASRIVPAALAGRAGLVLLSALVVHVAWHSMVERASALWDGGWPPLDPQSLIIVARWIAGVALAIGAARYVIRRAGARPATAQ